MQVASWKRQCRAPLFTPVMQVQRFDFVKNFITNNGSISKVVDFGCGEALMVKWLKPIDNVTTYFGVDDYTGPLYEALSNTTRSLPGGYEKNFRVNLFHGSMSVKDKRFGRGDVDLVTCMESIEHICLEDVPALSENIFRFIQPRYVIISTPNFEYNELIQEQSLRRQNRKLYELLYGNDEDYVAEWIVKGYRVFDHKFEWSRLEFTQWCESTINLYPQYSYSIDGVGILNANEDRSQGFATQIAVFKRNGEFKQAAKLRGIDIYYDDEDDECEDVFKTYAHYGSRVYRPSRTISW